MSDQITTLSRSELVPWPDLNPRRRFMEEELEELRTSLRKDGMLQPVGVCLQEEAPHWIFAGERRWRAAEGVLEELPVLVREIDEETARRLALTENIQRDQLTAVEEAEGLERYILASGKTQKEIAGELGKTQSWISNRLRLLRLPKTILELVQDGQITATQARDLILPFSKIESELWKELSKDVAKRLVKESRKRNRELVDDEVRRIVSAVAVPMSGWLDRPHYGTEEPPEGLTTFTLDPKYWKTAPRGSLVQYDYGHYGGVQSTRCFDAEWWLHAMRKEQRRREKRKERFTAPEGEELGPDLEWTQEDGSIPGEVSIPYRQRHVLFELGSGRHLDPLIPIGPLVRTEDASEKLYDREWTIYADPSVVPVEELILYEGSDEHWNPPAILVRTEESFLKAEEALRTERDRMKEKRWKTAAQEDHGKRAKKGRWNDSLAVVVALSRARLSHHRDLLALVYEVAEDLEIELPSLELDPYGRYGPDSVAEAHMAYEALRDVDGLASIMAVLRFRLTDEDAAWQSREGRGLMVRESIERAVNFELRWRYYRELQELELPFTIPEPPETPEEE